MLPLAKILISFALLCFFEGGFVLLPQRPVFAVEAKSVRLVGYSDLQGRDT
jgi:hypothetical protein